MSPTPIANEHQRRRYAVFLELLEKSLDKVEWVIARTNGPATTGLAVFNADVAPRFVTDAAPIITELRKRILRLAEKLELPRVHHSAYSAIRATLTSEIVRVEDTFSDKLRGYGPVDSSLRTEIDPELLEIQSSLNLLLEHLHSAERA